MGHSTVKFASGHNGSPQSLDQLSGSLLAEYGDGETVLTHWHDQIDRVLNGSRDWIDIGLPWTEWILYRLTRAEFALLLTYSGDATIYCLNQKTNVYHTYNAKLKPPTLNASGESEWEPILGGWQDVKLTFFDLEALD